MYGLNFPGKIGGDNEMKVKLYCTDKNQHVEADVMNYRRGVFLEAVVNTVKLNLQFNKDLYVGSMAGLEFTAREDDIVEDYKYKEFRRRSRNLK